MTHSCNVYVDRARDHAKIFDSEGVSVVLKGNLAPASLEIGCSHGLFFRRLVEANPDFLCLGLDYKFKEVVLTADKVSGYSNAIVIKAEVRSFIEKVPDESFNSLLCFYPDPWPKRRQSKNRYWTRNFVLKLSAKMAPHGMVFLKTDQHSYFQEMLAAFQATSFIPILHGQYSQNSLFFDPFFSSYFEELFFRKGEKTFFLIAQKFV